jgi:hypothetical protein
MSFAQNFCCAAPEQGQLASLLLATVRRDTSTTLTKRATPTLSSSTMCVCAVRPTFGLNPKSWARARRARARDEQLAPRAPIHPQLAPELVARVRLHGAGARQLLTRNWISRRRRRRRQTYRLASSAACGGGGRASCWAGSARARCALGQAPAAGCVSPT